MDDPPLTSPAGIELDLNNRIYPLAVIQKAAVAISLRCATQIDQNIEDHITITLRNRLDAPPLADPVATFMGLLNDLALQERVADQTRDIRNALVRAALLEALPSKK